MNNQALPRVLFYGEGPNNMTGFSLVNRHLTRFLSEVATVEYVATSNYRETPNAPYFIHLCPNGSTEPGMRNLDIISQRIESKEWDIFFHQGDIGANDDMLSKAIEIAQEDPSKTTIYYAPLDIDDAPPQVFNVLRSVHVPVLYTEQGVKVVSRLVPEAAGKLSAIGLGTEPDIFYPLSQEERRAARLKLFNVDDDDTFIVVNNNRNQMRKDLARSMAYFHQFHVRHPNSMFFIHALVDDYGGNLILQAMMAGCDVLKQPCEIAFSNVTGDKPWSQISLNEMYNAADCLISTSYGEGWGLTTTEAMCCELPVLVPRNTANFDIVGANEERGYLTETGGDLDHTVYLYGGGNGLPHDVVHLNSFLNKLEYIYYHRGEAKEKAKVARAWCLENTWERRGEQWKQLLRLLSQQPSMTATAMSS